MLSYGSMAAPKEILDLVARFEAHREEYCAPGFNEAQLRIEFLNPLLKALHWDVDNEQNFAQSYREVIHEASVKVGDATKAPDYSLRIGGQRKLFVEAKKPAVNLKDLPEPAFQLRRYAWSAKLPLSILTNFREFAVYDTRIKPDQRDKAGHARVMYLTCEEYAEKWDEIAALFDRQAIPRGALDRYAEDNKRKRGTAEVDEEFLKEIEGWRDLLAANLALRNTGLEERDVNTAVQATIDRIVFLRIAEDRGIEPYGRLQDLLRGEATYRRLCQLFIEADNKYNSGLFHFRPEKDRPGQPDRLTPGLSLDDKELKAILSRLYYPESPYAFSVISADILGQVYEQFLGKVIRLTAGHRAKVEEKPEVRKAGGVFYTPVHIVDYIVNGTVGALLEEQGRKSPPERDEDGPIEGTLKILDPSCGSGSFLLGAYQHLLDWHLNWYSSNNPVRWCKGKAPRLVESPGAKSAWRLSLSERRRILLEHIHGVDIDPQAVEVTKLSLLLKVLEGDAGALAADLAMERALPDLDGNIQCGNSLVGPDIYNGQGSLGLGDEEAHRVNIMDWQRAFPAVMRSGGFDAVIGNPPYVRIQTLREFHPETAEYLGSRYRSAGKGNYDIYVVFVERGLQLLNPHGLLGFILPHKFFNAQYGEPLRALIAGGGHLSEVVHFGHQQVFSNATTYTCLLFLSKRPVKTARIQHVEDLETWRVKRSRSKKTIDSIPAFGLVWNFDRPSHFARPERFVAMPGLGELARVFVGTQTSADDVFVVTECKARGKYVEGWSEALQERVRFELALAKPFLKGRDIRRYAPPIANACLLCPYEIGEDKARLYTIEEMKERFPLALEYLSRNRKRLAKRKTGRTRRGEWHAFGYPKNMTDFGKVKIVVPDYDNKAAFTLDTKGRFYKTGYGILVEPSLDLSPLYVLGLLNSKLLFEILLTIGTKLRGGYVRFWTQYISKLPIRTIVFDDKEDKKLHDRMVSLVESMLELNRRLAEAKSPHDQQVLQRQIEAADQQIDQLVYELYELTPEEIAIVEGQAE